MKTNATAREEVRRFPDRYIASVKTPDGWLLQSSREIRDAFRAHFRDRFACCTDLPLREFRRYFADFPHLGVAEAASCEGVVTECEVHDALKQVGFNKSPGLDGLPYEVYLRMSHMFVPILTDMFNHWFAQGAIPGSVTKGVITLLKKGGRHVWEGLDDYRPITLLSTELKILAWVLANRLQLVISDLIGPEHTFAVKGRSIQDNLHLIREDLEGIEDDTEAVLISLDQSKAFDRVDHRFLATVLETAGFKPKFRRWISMMYDNPQAVVQVNGRRSGTFAIECSVRQCCPLSPLLYVLELEPLLRRLRDEGTSPSLRGIPFVSRLAARVFAFADDITVFVSRCLDIKAMKEAVVEYERIAGAKVNFDKSEGLRLGAWRGSNTFPVPFRWSDGPIRILGVWFGPDLPLERNWSEVQTKVNAQVEIWLSRRLSLKGRVEACVTYVFLLILYRLAVLPLPKARRLALKQSLSRLLWGGARPMVRRQVCIQRMRNGGLGMPDMESHWLAERLAYLGRSLTGDSVWRRKASRTFPRLKSDPKAKGRRKPLGEALFVREYRRALRNLLVSSDLSRPRKELYRKLVVGSASDPLSERRGCTAEEIRSHWNWAPESSFLEQLRVLAHLVTCTECVTPSRLDLQSGSWRHAWLPSLRQWLGWNGWARLLPLRASSPVLGSRRGVDGSHRTQTACAARRWLRRRQRSSSVSGWEACGVSRDPSCSSNGDLVDAKQGIVWRCKLFSLWSGFVLGSHNFQQKVGECREPGRKKGENFGVFLPSSSGSWRQRYGSLGTPSLVSRSFFPPWNIVSSMLWVIVPVI